MPLQATSGAASYDAFGGGAPAGPATYIEDVFSTWLYTGTGATQTITNGIDLSTNGGLVWFKPRSTANNHNLIDNARGLNKFLITNATNAEGTAGAGYGVTSFNTTGFTLGDPWTSSTNTTSTTYASWTFRKQPKFFDVVTYTGTGSARTVAHNLGSVPACIIVKKTSNADNWAVYHRSLTATDRILLNTTGATAAGSAYWNNTEPTASVFTVNTVGATNEAGETYVAYLFAHDAGGFGLTGTDNVISCGSFTTDGSGNATVSLGYEPQWLMVKASSAVQSWYIEDNMRAFNLSSRAILFPNLSNAEATGASAYLAPNSTGFSAVNGQLSASTTYIYIAIRRGPMKVPTTGTSVFSPLARTGTGTNTSITTGFVTDSTWSSQRAGGYRGVFDRLRGSNNVLFQNSTGAEDSTSYTDTLTSFANNTGVNVGADASWGGINLSGASEATYAFKRAPSFFDEVCYTGNGSTQTINHNLGVVPEMMIVKERDTTGAWRVYVSSLGNTNHLVLNSDGQVNGGDMWNSTNPTSTVFSVGTSYSVNRPAGTFVNYLFATCAGVSKVGSYTGNGTTQTIDCGFGAGGARFVLIKRTDSTGDWYVYDTARGMTTLTDPYLLLNSTAAEAATLGSVTTVSTGFAVNASVLAAINTNAASYIFLAIS
jgi:hypothetical protein